MTEKEEQQDEQQQDQQQIQHQQERKTTKQRDQHQHVQKEGVSINILQNTLKINPFKIEDELTHRKIQLARIC